MEAMVRRRRVLRPTYEGRKMVGKIPESARVARRLGKAKRAQQRHRDTFEDE
jgi:hypothetical protein